MTVDQWAAEQCGVSYKRYYEWLQPGDYQTFDITKASDREIVREHFGIYTRPCKDDRSEWTCISLLIDDVQEWGKTIAEAEIACITAIWEASK